MYDAIVDEYEPEPFVGSPTLEEWMFDQWIAARIDNYFEDAV
jgi:hypothetical protein